MELVLAKRDIKEVSWKQEWGQIHKPGEIVSVPVSLETLIIDNHLVYNNTLSLNPTLIENDWELQLDIVDFEKYNISMGDWIYVPNSEFGGVVEDIERNDRIIKVSGANFRGYLARHIVSPPLNIKTGTFGSYTTINSNANDMLWSMWSLDHSEGESSGMWYDENVLGVKKQSDVFIKDSVRYDTYLSAMTKILNKNNLRLQTKQIYIDYEDIENSEFKLPPFYRGTETFVFSLSAEPIKDYSNDDIFSQDYNIRIKASKQNMNERKFLWCLGSGEMEQREIVVLENGEPVRIGLLDTMGSLWNSAIFDYPNAESREELIKAGKEKYLESYLKKETIDLFVDDSNLEFFLGDIIAGKDFITGIESKAEIVSKELTISDGTHEIRYKVGGH